MSSFDWTVKSYHQVLTSPDWTKDNFSPARRCCEKAEGAFLAHTDISYVVPPTPVTFLTLPWRLGLRWQSICPLTFMVSLSGKRRQKQRRFNTKSKSASTQNKEWKHAGYLFGSQRMKSQQHHGGLFWCVLLEERKGDGRQVVETKACT